MSSELLTVNILFSIFFIIFSRGSDSIDRNVFTGNSKRWRENENVENVGNLSQYVLELQYETSEPTTRLTSHISHLTINESLGTV